MPDPKGPIPKQIRYIIGNEGCERFSFYGMRNILMVFLVTSLSRVGKGKTSLQKFICLINTYVRIIAGNGESFAAG